MVSGGEEISHKCPGSSQFGNDDKEGDFHQFQNGKHVALSCLMKMGKEWGPKKTQQKQKQNRNQSPSAKEFGITSCSTRSLINPECISKIINDLDTSNATQQGDIPTKIIKDNKDLFSFLFLQAVIML